MKLLDPDIRLAVLEMWTRERPPGTILMQEFQLQRMVVSDVAAVGPGYLDLLEIKSDGDSLRRLKSQVRAYSAVATMAWLAVGTKLLEKARAAVPGWWGILAASSDRAGDPVQIEVARGALPNPEVVPHSVADLLWKTEVETILSRAGVKVPRSRCRDLKCRGHEPTKHRLNVAAAEHLGLSSVRGGVYLALMDRKRDGKGPDGKPDFWAKRAANPDRFRIIGGA